MQARLKKVGIACLMSSPLMFPMLTVAFPVVMVQKDKSYYNFMFLIYLAVEYWSN